MNLERFLQERQPAWAELDSLVRAAKRRPERLGPDGVRRLGSLYRRAAADLALGRRRFPLEPAVAALDDLVGRARHLVYESEARRQSPVQFFVTGYWRRVLERPAPLLVAAALLLGCGALSGAWAVADPGSAVTLVPAELRSVTEPRGADGPGLSSAASAAFSSMVFTNNIRVTFLAFAGGMVLGLGTAAVLLYNGALLGVVGGLAASSGNGASLLEAVAPHGVLELSCIVVAGAAGLRLGWAIVEPGRGRRSDAMVAEARRAVELALGTAPWLVLAGLVEGYVTPAWLGPGPATLVGVVLGGVYWALVAWRGRPPVGVTAEPWPSS